MQTLYLAPSPLLLPKLHPLLFPPTSTLPLPTSTLPLPPFPPSTLPLPTALSLLLPSPRATIAISASSLGVGPSHRGAICGSTVLLSPGTASAVDPDDPADDPSSLGVDAPLPPPYIATRPLHPFIPLSGGPLPSSSLGVDAPLPPPIPTRLLAPFSALTGGPLPCRRSSSSASASTTGTGGTLSLRIFAARLTLRPWLTL